MARPDFEKVWADSRPSIPEISDPSYALGFEDYLGSQPPTTDDHDYIMNLQDRRAAWLGEQMLLAVGHEWQSDVTYDQYAVTRSPVNGQLYRSLTVGNIGNEPSASGAQWALGVADFKDFLNTARIDVASASTVNLTTAAPNTRHINITGTTTINGFTVAAGQCYFVRFNAALTLTNSTGLVTNSGANRVTAAGDTCIVRATAANTVEILCGDFLSEAAVGTRGQTWQDVKSSRISGVTYTNTTGRAIQLSISAQNSATASGITLVVNGVLVLDSSVIGSGAILDPSAFPVVAPGGDYTATLSGGMAIRTWAELR